MINSLDNILIVEDEPLIAEDINETLSQAGHSVVGIAHNADDAIKILKSNRVSLALLDIEIDGNIDGLMLGSMINADFNIPFIFLTSFTDQKTIEKILALKPYGYIVKPFDDSELVTNVNLAILKFKEKSEQLVSVENSLENSFFLRQNGSLIKVHTSDILYAEAFDNYCFIHTLGAKYLLPHTLKSVEKKLEKLNFMRVHRSFLANLNSIEVINEDHLVINKAAIPLSKNTRSDLVKRISLL